MVYGLWATPIFMKIKSDLDGVIVTAPEAHHDSRGSFRELFNEITCEFAPTSRISQINYSRSDPGVLRGLHYQTEPRVQEKFVSVLGGIIQDVVVDLRSDSETYGQWRSFTLARYQQIWIPKGFAHGFCVLGDDTAEILYTVGDIRSEMLESGIKYDDPTLNIEWLVRNPKVSDKDRRWPLFKADRTEFLTENSDRNY